MSVDLVKQVYKWVEEERQNWPVNSNRASQLGDDCERKLVYWRTRWQEAALPSVELSLIFREGRYAEKAVLDTLRQAGVEVIREGEPLSWPEYQITGRIDAIVAVDSKYYPLEIKSSNPNVWRTIAYMGPGVYSWEEVKEAFERKPWLRRYLAQITLYMLCSELEEGLMLFKNKSTGALCQINVNLDYEYAEQLVKRAERINKHIAEGTLPDRIDFDPEVCPKCPFFHLCLPGHDANSPLKYVSDEFAVEKIKALLKLKEASQEYKRLYNWVKEWVWEKHPDADRVTVGGDVIIEKKRSKSGAKLMKISAATEEGENDG